MTKTDVLVKKIKILIQLIDEYNNSELIDVTYANFLENERKLALDQYFKLYGENIVYIDFT